MFDDATEPLDRLNLPVESALSRQVFRKIRQWIREGRLKEGDLLPSERELAKVFETSRVPVREALKVLEFMGIAERVAGKGVYLRRISVGNLISNIDFLLMSSAQNLMDLFEARECLEIQAARLAAARRTEIDLSDIKEALEAMEQNLTAAAVPLGVSMDFHAAVIAASHNMVLGELSLYLADWLRLARDQFLELSKVHERGMSDHRAIYEAIRESDGERAAQAMQTHLTRTRTVIEDALKAQLDSREGGAR